MQTRLAVWVLCASSLSPACASDSVANPAGDASVGRVPDASTPLDASARDAGRTVPADADSGRATGAPPEVLASAEGWPMANHDYRATRAAVGSSITRATIARLEEAWSFELPGGGTFGAATAVPIVIGDVVYYQDMGSNVFALDRVTGKVIWQKKYSRTSPGPNGVAVGWGKVFVATSDRSFAALDLADGTEAWKADIPVPKNGGIDMAPLAYGGLVYTSTVPVNSNAGYVGAATGILYALDQRDGRIVWSFDTDESGNLWGNEAVNSGGGAWYPPSIDPSRGTMYWGTGNPGPVVGTADFPNGSSRPGPNLYTSSVLALSYDQGKLLFYHQEKAHDLFDLDFQNTPVIADVKVDGRSRRVAIGSGKTGTVVALDAESGELIWRAPVGKHQNDNATTVPDAGFWVYPGGLGGVETAIAYADGVVYVPINDAGMFYTPAGTTEGADPTSALLALDASTGAVKWHVRYGGDDGGAPGQLDVGGATVVNDLVVTSTLDGTLRAHDKDSGDAVWTHAAPAGINASPAIAGDSLYVAAGAGLGVPKLVALRLK